MVPQVAFARSKSSKLKELKESMLRKCLFTSESALRLALAEFQAYFNHERPHQGIDNRTVLGSSEAPTVTGKVVRIPRVGGLLNHYPKHGGSPTIGAPARCHYDAKVETSRVLSAFHSQDVRCSGKKFFQECGPSRWCGPLLRSG